MITLLFTDLVRSTELADRLGEAEADELRRMHFRLLRQAVAHGGGWEVKNLGDGLMVAFDSPAAAVRCAVAMQQALDDYNLLHPDRALAVRIGMHAGEPVREDGDFFGMAVTIAKRLCDRARGGQILTTEEMADLAGPQDVARFRPAGRLTLKGLARPVSAVAVEWRATARRPSLPAADPGGRPPDPKGPKLVGRDEELALLSSHFARAQGGEFRCLLVAGDPGVGKTRLAREFLARQPEEVITLAGRAHPLGATTSFGLWVEALERYLRSLPPEEVADLCGGLLDDLTGLLRSVAVVRGDEPAGKVPRFRILEALAALLGNLARRGSLAVVFDDVHLADASSLGALHYLARMLPDTPVLVVLTARSSEMSEQSVTRDLVADLDQEGVLDRLHLGPLGPEALADLAETMTGRAAPTSLVEWLTERSRGYVLFAVGLLQALLDEGAELSAPALRSLPEGLADRVRSRLAILQHGDVSTLEVLAVVGRPLSYRRLEGLSDEGPERLTSSLERLVRLRLATEEERGRDLSYELAHPLVREVVYDSIGLARRRFLHRLVGRSLLESGQLGEAVPHFARASEVGDCEAIGVLQNAMRQAEERQAYREALSILGTLVELLPPGDTRWLQVLDAMSWQAEWVVDHRADDHAVMGIAALRAMDAMLALQPSADPTTRGAVKFRLTSFLAWGTGELEEAEETCRAARALFDVAGDRPRAIVAANELAWIRGMRGDPMGWQAGAAEAAQEARELGGTVATLPAFSGVGYCALFRGQFGEAEAAFRQNVAMAREEASGYRLTVCLVALAAFLAFEGRVDESFPLIARRRRGTPRTGTACCWSGRRSSATWPVNTVRQWPVLKRHWPGTPVGPAAGGALASSLPLWRRLSWATLRRAAGCSKRPPRPTAGATGCSSAPTAPTARRSSTGRRETAGQRSACWKSWGGAFSTSKPCPAPVSSSPTAPSWPRSSGITALPAGPRPSWTRWPGRSTGRSTGRWP
jgi:class 3 adenylate cyclase/tetratricopeptide (TPR) repeat protein